ncbi:MAG TPA: histidinol dehydrogenase [Acidimicrobiia bacterium]|nr:histidinol dehydrogenase [Acidimicrobiia bacterium]
MSVHSRIERFCRAQREGLSDLTIQVAGGQAGHRWIPVGVVGAYPSGNGRSLPSSVLMTVTPARVAGVTGVWLASPRPSPLTLAAGWVAGADGLLRAGGAHAVAAMAFGTVSPPVDMIVGGGDRLVSAAKRHLYGEVGIDGLAGPGQIVVMADSGANPALVAADLLAQAEQDPDAVPALIAVSTELVDPVQSELSRQVADLPTAEVARAALGNGYYIVVDDFQHAAALSDAIAPDYLALHVADPRAVAMLVRSYGSLLIGGTAAPAFVEQGAGPNHMLPTGGAARFQAGLSVMTFLKPSTWLSVDRPDELIEDSAQLARLENLEAHARAARARER